jgi:hypothetical protein
VISGVADPNDATTSVKECGVDEGCIVKQLGRFLMVLMEGRLFAVDQNALGGITLASRWDIYRHMDDDVWIDERLTFGACIVITGCLYGREAMGISVFSLSDSRAFACDGVSAIIANDHYDTENYTARIISDNPDFYNLLGLQFTGPPQNRSRCAIQVFADPPAAAHRGSRSGFVAGIDAS